MNSTVINQDDCIAINSGSNIVFQNNICSNGHGISIGSIASGKTVSSVVISGNTVTNSAYGLRIKVNSDATNGGVSSIIYSGNNVSSISKYGILITQSYSEDFGTPGKATTIRYARIFLNRNSTGSQTHESPTVILTSQARRRLLALTALGFESVLTAAIAAAVGTGHLSRLRVVPPMISS